MLLLGLSSSVTAFMMIPRTATTKTTIASSSPVSRASSSRLFLAGGFGGSAGGDKKKKAATNTKLKPKQQWDRYLALKKESKIRVAVRCVVDDSSSDVTEEWLEVGRVRTQDDKYTESAVARQRALIAEVSAIRRN
jgi:hypothetical protein